MLLARRRFQAQTTCPNILADPAIPASTRRRIHSAPHHVIQRCSVRRPLKISTTPLLQFYGSCNIIIM